ncbi:MAG: zinc-dependent metalloprotease [Calditrichia bacterium]
MKYFIKMMLFLLIASCVFAQPKSGDSSQSPKTIAEITAKMQQFEGFFTFYWDAENGKIWLEIDKLETEFLYVNALATGVGSNDIGLDRGQLGGERIVKFVRSGPKVLLLQPNYSFRAITENTAERLAVEEAFAQSVLWGGEVVAESGNSVLVDASSFFLRDAHNVTGTLSQSGQGSFSLDASRSAFYLPRTKNFPKNSEFEVTLTFAGNSPGSYVRQVVPTPQAITVRQHHSFVKLPENSYKPRVFDPRSGYFGIEYMDYATPISEPIVKRFIARHHLEKKNPGAAMSEAVEPIVYYLDPGTPEPIRSALLEGAQWWNQAFEAAGYQNAFQVKMLPEGADPLDIRYSVIQWVHRSTRGWSYGSTVTDPRTGEILKGHVSLGSLRVRQDFLIAAGLLSPYESGKPVSPEMQEMALARIRQLSAHEVGHTLGLAHNFAASVNNRASVMDYPHPLATLDDTGNIDLSDAYDTGIGEWDKAAIAYGYQDFPEGTDEKSGLNAIVSQTISQGLKYISDADARPAGGAHPFAHLWDNGSNPVDELNRVLNVRSVALANFSENNIREDAPMATLEEVLVPIYLFHRYQLEGAAKLLGGLNYSYAVRGDGQTVTEMVPPSQQRYALAALIRTIQPEVLAIPENILRLIPPRPYGYWRDREMFDIRTGVTFDPLSAAETAADMTVGLLLHPERAARLVEYHSRDNAFPGLAEVLDKVIQSTWQAKSGNGYPGEIQRVVNNVVLYHLMVLAANEKAVPQVRAIAFLKLDELKTWLTTSKPKIKKDPNQLAEYVFAISQISQFQENPEKLRISKPGDPPAGSPIGADQSFDERSGWGCGWR